MESDAVVQGRHRLLPMMRVSKLLLGFELFEHDDLDRRLLLMEWVKLLLERPALIEPLGLVEILIRRVDDEHEEGSKVISSRPIIGYDQEQGLQVAKTARSQRITASSRMADVLTRIFRRAGWKQYRSLMRCCRITMSACRCLSYSW